MVWCLIKSSRETFSSLGCFLLADNTLNCVTALCTNGGRVPLLLVLLPLVRVNGANFREFVMGVFLMDCVVVVIVVGKVISMGDIILPVPFMC